jgi:hypothetical protein
MFFEPNCSRFALDVRVSRNHPPKRRINVASESKALPPVSRIASAAGALAITSILLLAVGLGFPARASAESAVAVPAGAVPLADGLPGQPVGFPTAKQGERG